LHLLRLGDNAFDRPSGNETGDEKHHDRNPKEGWNDQKNTPDKICGHPIYITHNGYFFKKLKGLIPSYGSSSLQDKKREYG
jgi:hypothetical protein